MILQEWKSDGTQWVMQGQWNDLKEDEVQPLVDEWLTRGTKLVLCDDEGDYEREWVNDDE